MMVMEETIESEGRFLCLMGVGEGGWLSWGIEKRETSMSYIAKSVKALTSNAIQPKLSIQLRTPFKSLM